MAEKSKEELQREIEELQTQLEALDQVAPDFSPKEEPVEKNDATLTVRMPTSLHENVRVRAAELTVSEGQDVSMNTLMVRAAQEYVRKA